MLDGGPGVRARCDDRPHKTVPRARARVNYFSARRRRTASTVRDVRQADHALKDAADAAACAQRSGGTPPSRGGRGRVPCRSGARRGAGGPSRRRWSCTRRGGLVEVEEDGHEGALDAHLSDEATVPVGVEEVARLRVLEEPQALVQSLQAPEAPPTATSPAAPRSAARRSDALNPARRP